MQTYAVIIVQCDGSARTITVQALSSRAAEDYAREVAGPDVREVYTDRVR